MKILRRTSIAIAILFVAQYFLAPAIVLYFVRKAPEITRVVPAPLKELSVSQADGTKLAYLGYEFEVPWSDLDESRTQVSESTKHLQTVWLSFRSGLNLFISTSPAKDLREYALLKQTYAVTPDQIHYWTLFKGGHYRDARLLMAKSAFLETVRTGSDANPAATGIFDIQGKGFLGFQYGDPQKWQSTFELRLFSEDGRVDILILQGPYDDPMGVTQPEINRIIQSLHKAVPSDSSKSLTATSN